MTQAVKLAQIGSPGVSTGFKNRIINGAMMIDQRNAGASFTPVDNAYGLDRYRYSLTQASKMTAQQSSTTPSGVGFSYLHTVGASANVTVGASDIFAFSQIIEGFNTADLKFGTASASTVTLSFWVQSSVTGTFSVALLNGAANRSYVSTYTISSANTWEQKSITIAGDTSGTWVGATNGSGLRVYFDLGAGSNYTASAGSWQSGAFTHATGSTNWITTNSATFYITSVQLEVGTTATDFEYVDYGRQLAQCYRYFFKSNTNNDCTILSMYATSGQTAFRSTLLPVSMRTNPTVTITDNSNLGFNNSTVANTDTGYFRTDAVANTTSATGYIRFQYTASAEL